MSFTTFPRYQKKWGHSFTSLKDITNDSTQASSPPPQQEETPAMIQPRFSVFGKKARFTSLKQSIANENQQETKETPVAEPAPRRFIKKFECHSKGMISNVAAANEQEKQQILSENDQHKDPSADIMTIQTNFDGKKKKSVHFDPCFLESVCLFTKTQIPKVLKTAHDKRLKNPTFRIICPHWPRYSKQEEKTNTIMLDKKSFLVSRDNASIKGKILVRNLALDKSVSIRYTFNSWNTVNDVDAIFFGPNPKNPLYDIYEFAIRFGHGQLADRGEMRGKIEFSVQMTADTRDYMDNNNGRNYLIRVISDPLNDPWEDEEEECTNGNMEHNKEDNNSNEQEDEDEDDQEEMYYREHEDVSEKDSSFTNALKGYKHARPLHLNKRQPWLGTRYDFSHSLSLAKKACNLHSNESLKPKIEPMVNASDYFIQQPSMLSPQEEKDENAMNVKVGGPCYAAPKRPSPPPSPSLSPTHPPTFPMTDLCTLIDVNSNYYLDLLNKYCFYTSTPSSPTEQSFFPISSNS
ncbi:carbohydrate-binding module family 21 protein [Backusella circina FSU 941]|nr:carbohydrate-binding module family 21 protein [Backusella circina FSU 941]